MSNFSFTDHQGGGGITTFPFSFVGQGNGYLRESDIHVFVDNVEVLYSLSGTNQVTISPAPSSGSLVRIRRIMPKDEPFADFSRGNAFTQDLLNKSFLQTLYSYHEFLDGFLPEFPFQLKGKIEAEGLKLSGILDMNNNRIINLEEPVLSTDAATKGYFDGFLNLTTNQADIAIAAAASALASKNEAKQSEILSKDYSDSARDSALQISELLENQGAVLNFPLDLGFITDTPVAVSYDLGSI